jgi:hypothetical protein
VDSEQEFLPCCRHEDLKQEEDWEAGVGADGPAWDKLSMQCL